MDMNRSVDMTKVAERLSVQFANQMASKDQRIAMLEVALEQALIDAAELQQKLGELEGKVQEYEAEAATRPAKTK